MRRGVSDYLIAPIGALQVVRAVCGLFSAPDAKPVGRVIAVVGAKGGVGASTVAHNIAFSIARDLMLDSVVTDLDLAFGTAGLDFNQDPPQGIAEAVFSPDRIDNAFIDRLLSKCTDHLSLLAAPATLDHVYDFGADAFESIFDSLRATVPCVVLDVPHQWTGWTKQTLVGADDILIVAAPDLANLRNTKNLYDFLKTARPNDHLPLYCLNQVGVPEAAGDQGRRFRQGARKRAGRGHSVRTAAIRRGGEQRADDRRDCREPSHRRGDAATGAAADRSRGAEEATFKPVVATLREASATIIVAVIWCRSSVRVWQASQR